MPTDNRNPEAQPGSLHPAGCATSLNIEEIFATLKAAEMFIAVHKRTPYSETCECGSCRVTRSLNNVREVMWHNAKAEPLPPTASVADRKNV